MTANPTDLASAARIFHYWKAAKQFNASAERALAEFRQRKEKQEVGMDGRRALDARAVVSNRHTTTTKAARDYYALYNVARGDDKMAATALGSLARLLLSAPEQAIRFGSGNLTLYRDVATMDPHPGFLNGALSLLLNSSDPGDRYKQEET